MQDLLLIVVDYTFLKHFPSQLPIVVAKFHQADHLLAVTVEHMMPSATGGR